MIIVECLESQIGGSGGAEFNNTRQELQYSGQRKETEGRGKEWEGGKGKDWEGRKEKGGEGKGKRGEGKGCAEGEARRDEEFNYQMEGGPPNISWNNPSTTLNYTRALLPNDPATNLLNHPSSPQPTSLQFTTTTNGICGSETPTGTLKRSQSVGVTQPGTFDRAHPVRQSIAAVRPAALTVQRKSMIDGQLTAGQSFLNGGQGGLYAANRKAGKSLVEKSFIPKPSNLKFIKSNKETLR